MKKNKSKAAALKKLARLITEVTAAQAAQRVASEAAHAAEARARDTEKVLNGLKAEVFTHWLEKIREGQTPHQTFSIGDGRTIQITANGGVWFTETTPL